MFLKVPLVVLSLAILSGARISASPVSGSLDKLEIDDIARHVCQSAHESGAQISRISTIVKLDDHFHGLAEGQVDSRECIDMLHSLRELVETNSNNVCSGQTISAIENFHRSYVLGGEDVPVLRLFFLHYASEVSATCEKVMVANLESTVGDHFSAGDYQAVESGAPAQASRKILSGLNGEPEDQVNLLLLSGLIEKDDDQESVNPLTGEPVQFYIKERDVGAANALSEKCQRKFKPVYQGLVLPVIRLANLGYSDSQLQAAEQNELIRRWISIAQVCELVLSTRYIEDASLASDEVVSISKIESQQYPTEAPRASESPLVIAPIESPLDDVLKSVQNTDALSLVEKINSKLHARDLAKQKALEILSNTVKRIPENKVFVSLPTDCEQDRCNYNLVDMKESIGSSLEQLASQQVPPAKLEGDVGKGRHRSAKQFLQEKTEAIGNVAYAVKWLGVVLYWIASGAGTG